jgi:hypothetical protein
VLGIHVKANFSKLLGTLADMFKGYKQLSPILFEDVVFVGIVNHLLKWTVCSSADPTLKWKPFSSFDKIETSEVFHRNQKMKPGVLYRPINTNFPGVDFLFLDGNTVSTIQLTTSDTHPKDCSVYMKLFDLISLAPEEKIKMFVVCQEKHADAYASGMPGKLVERLKQLESGSEHYGQSLTDLYLSYVRLNKDINLLLKEEKAHQTKQNTSNPTLESSGTKLKALIEEKNRVASTIVLSKIEFNVLKFQQVTQTEPTTNK